MPEIVVDQCPPTTCSTDDVIVPAFSGSTARRASAEDLRAEEDEDWTIRASEADGRGQLVTSFHLLSPPCRRGGCCDQSRSRRSSAAEDTGDEDDDGGGNSRRNAEFPNCLSLNSTRDDVLVASQTKNSEIGHQLVTDPLEDDEDVANSASAAVGGIAKYSDDGPWNKSSSQVNMKLSNREDSGEVFNLRPSAGRNVVSTEVVGDLPNASNNVVKTSVSFEHKRTVTNDDFDEYEDDSAVESKAASHSRFVTVCACSLLPTQATVTRHLSATMINHFWST